MRTSLLSAAAFSLALIAAPSHADTLIGFTDGSSGTGATASVSDTTINWAVQWTQTVSTSNVTLSALLSSNVGAVPGNWWVTNAIGAGTTLANVVAAGSYTAPNRIDNANFNVLPRTTLGTGLNFAAGTYYLVLDGPAGQFVNNANWLGDFTGITTTLAPGFSIGNYAFSTSPNAFAPASGFTPHTQASRFVFELATPGVPEPASWALLIAGFGLVGASMRTRGSAERRGPAEAGALSA